MADSLETGISRLPILWSWRVLGRLALGKFDGGIAALAGARQRATQAFTQAVESLSIPNFADRRILPAQVTGGPPEKAGDSEACRGSSKPAAVRQRVLRCWEDRILQRTTADSASGEREDAKGIVAKCSCLPKSSPMWVCSSDGLIFHVLPGVFQGSLRGSPAAGGNLECRFHRTPEPSDLRNVGHHDSV